MNKRIAKPALLLLGPTGSGKTPLGDALMSRRFRGRRCVHFDFGQRLREVASGAGTGFMTNAERAFLTEVLAAGALLENETFCLAEKIITHFLDREGRDAELVVLNGLPRHCGQAVDIVPFFNVQQLVVLRCACETIVERLRMNSGGDRTYRTDDHLELVSKKLLAFNTRTSPLVSFYRDAGCVITEIAVEINTTPQEIISTLEADKRSSGSSTRLSQ